MPTGINITWLYFPKGQYINYSYNQEPIIKPQFLCPWDNLALATCVTFIRGSESKKKYWGVLIAEHIIQNN